MKKGQKEFTEGIDYIIDKNGCHIWQHYINKYGYGHVWFNNKLERAHRLIWIILRGDIPNGFCVCHKCDVRSCINPEHLFLGTNLDNVIDKMNKNRCSRPISHISDEVVLAMRKRYKNGERVCDLAKFYGFNYGTIWDIVRYKTRNNVKE